MNALPSPTAIGQTGYAGRDRGTGGSGHGNVKSMTSPVQMVELTSPRNAIGGVSGVVTNQQSQYSNIMNRRKSNAMNNTHGPVDINAIMRATRGAPANHNDPQIPRQGQDQAGISA